MSKKPSNHPDIVDAEVVQPERIVVPPVPEPPRRPRSLQERVEGLLQTGLDTLEDRAHQRLQGLIKKL